MILLHGPLMADGAFVANIAPYEFYGHADACQVHRDRFEGKSHNECVCTCGQGPRVGETYRRTNSTETVTITSVGENFGIPTVTYRFGDGHSSDPCSIEYFYSIGYFTDLYTRE